MDGKGYGKRAVLSKQGTGIPSQAGCLLAKLCRSGGKRQGKPIYCLPVCLVLAACLWLACPACLRAADKLNFLPYETALQISRENHRPLLLFFTTPWCYYCREMKRKVFQDKDIPTVLNERFLLVEVDINQKKQLKEEFRINYTPTTVVLDSSGKTILDIKGYIPPNRFRKLLQYVSENHYKTIAFSDYEQQ